MKYNILIDQRTIAENFPDLDLKDAALLAFLADAFTSPHLTGHIIGAVRYTWISHTMIQQQMPLLGLNTADAIQKRLKRLRDTGLIITRMLESSKVGHAPGPAWDTLTGIRPPDEMAGASRMKRRHPPGSNGGTPPDETAGNNTIDDYPIGDNSPLPPEGEPGVSEFQKIPPPPQEAKPSKASQAKSRDHEGPHLYPPEFQESLKFCQALADYFRSRREKRSAATPTAAELIRKKLIASGLDIAIKALQDSAANGWTGVFPERFQDRPTKPAKPQSGQDEPKLNLGDW